MARIDRQKRALGHAIRRTSPSRTAQYIADHGLARGRVIDYGCGFGFDADHFGWESYDPYYRPDLPEGRFDTVVCSNVLSALTRHNRAKVIATIDDLLEEGGAAYLGVPRSLPVTGRLGTGHTLQNYVQLTLPVIHEDPKFAIYHMAKAATFKDRTKDHVSRRDARRDR